MELSLPHTLHLFNIFHENDGKENCAQLLEEECIKMFVRSLYDQHDCNVVSMNSFNIHDANDMQSYKLGEAMFDKVDIFCPPSFDEQIYYDESMPPIYDDYCDDMYALKNNDNHETWGTKIIIFIKCSFPKLVALHIISIIDIQGINTNNIAIMLIIQIFSAKHFVDLFF